MVLSTKVAIGLLQVLLAVSSQIYKEVVDAKNGASTKAQQEAIYDNVSTNHGNIGVLFTLGNQLKSMLGEIGEGLEDIRDSIDDEEDRRRLEEVDCKNTTDGFLSAPCFEPSCQDRRRLCDGSNNFAVIAPLRQGKQFD